eukprot:147845_1
MQISGVKRKRESSTIDIAEEKSDTRASTSSDTPHRADAVYVQYPPGVGRGVTVTVGDLNLLKDKLFLNDSLADFYLKYLEQTTIPTSSTSSFHVFNTFFFKKILSASESKMHATVKRWTRNVNIFEKDFLLVPVLNRQHWYLVIVCHLANVYTPQAQWRAPTHAPCILLMDSMDKRREHAKIFKRMRIYLTSEFKTKIGTVPSSNPFEEPVNLDFNRANLPGYNVEVPRQKDSWRCGDYMLQYAEEFCTMPFEDTSASEMVSRPDWFSKETVFNKRTSIRELLREMHVDQQNEDN